jgi:hypothetical protein
MANAKITSLPSASSLAGTEPLPIVQSGITSKTTVDAVAGRAGKAITSVVQFAASDETTALTTGTAKITLRMPHALTLTAVRASIGTASSSGAVTIDINKNGTSILSTKLTIDQGEKTSVTAATSVVISDANLADDDEITVDIDDAGTGAAGLKIALIGTR